MSEILGVHIAGKGTEGREDGATALLSTFGRISSLLFDPNASILVGDAYFDTLRSISLKNNSTTTLCVDGTEDTNSSWSRNHPKLIALSSNGCLYIISKDQQCNMDVFYPTGNRGRLNLSILLTNTSNPPVHLSVHPNATNLSSIPNNQPSNRLNNIKSVEKTFDTNCLKNSVDDRSVHELTYLPDDVIITFRDGIVYIENSPNLQGYRVTSFGFGNGVHQNKATRKLTGNHKQATFGFLAWATSITPFIDQKVAPFLSKAHYLQLHTSSSSPSSISNSATVNQSISKTNTSDIPERIIVFTEVACIRVILPDGNVQPLAGTFKKSGYQDGPALECLLGSYLIGSIASYGLFVSDCDNHAIRLIRNEIISTVTKTNPSSFSLKESLLKAGRPSYPSHITWHGDGSLIVSQAKEPAVFKLPNLDDPLYIRSKLPSTSPSESLSIYMNKGFQFSEDNNKSPSFSTKTRYPFGKVSKTSGFKFSPLLDIPEVFKDAYQLKTLHIANTEGKLELPAGLMALLGLEDFQNPQVQSLFEEQPFLAPYLLNVLRIIFSGDVTISDEFSIEQLLEMAYCLWQILSIRFFSMSTEIEKATPPTIPTINTISGNINSSSRSSATSHASLLLFQTFIMQRLHWRLVLIETKKSTLMLLLKHIFKNCGASKRLASFICRYIFFERFSNSPCDIAPFMDELAELFRELTEMGGSEFVACIKSEMKRKKVATFVEETRIDQDKVIEQVSSFMKEKVTNLYFNSVSLGKLPSTATDPSEGKTSKVPEYVEPNFRIFSSNATSNTNAEDKSGEYHKGIDKEYVDCHDWVLYIRWQFMVHVLGSGLSESSARTLYLPASLGWDIDTLRQFIHYIYTGELDYSSFTSIEDVQNCCRKLQNAYHELLLVDYSTNSVYESFNDLNDFIEKNLDTHPGISSFF